MVFHSCPYKCSRSVASCSKHVATCCAVLGVPSQILEGQQRLVTISQDADGLECQPKVVRVALPKFDLVLGQAGRAKATHGMLSSSRCPTCQLVTLVLAGSSGLNIQRAPLGFKPEGSGQPSAFEFTLGSNELLHVGSGLGIYPPEDPAPDTEQVEDVGGFRHLSSGSFCEDGGDLLEGGSSRRLPFAQRTFLKRRQRANGVCVEIQ